jgi:hypothetical protein
MLLTILARPFDDARNNRMDIIARLMTTVNALASLAILYEVPIVDTLDTVLVCPSGLFFLCFVRFYCFNLVDV